MLKNKFRRPVSGTDFVFQIMRLILSLARLNFPRRNTF
ncbi:MAG: hypothetical protein AVDCRST_MAG56-2151 [uncultured Cytophagales bacterium]|uniref:Uncharacterized protein n=1 Tax=uncultured Cytophagales bacterium TaxID=158755 RepID=A0A6J4IMA7_9SPHI|nr:MAG: hypothetical protein AVDCRST_MAG56-2151 [uncultured Cytophagales bacterium]